MESLVSYRQLNRGTLVANGCEPSWYSTVGWTMATCPKRLLTEITVVMMTKRNNLLIITNNQRQRYKIWLLAIGFWLLTF